ncbi:hypothetical protein QF042_003719 [Pedobacter sp. W3I1]|uniref:hypothetical protein n=1 Tax=Pedobacter sp. W3I1 TaxID=3042291 RepID=UPI00277FEC51|nr:hypothetical protein [Pedobacter sp. W3I1]MDQ0640154.1 hypothetical protein [Pedobacter sp. W3I1]
MKNLFTVLLLCTVFTVQAQKQIRDESIVNQQERMVFKQWDRKKFTPTSGFLGLNPYYWLTWGLHPNYPKTDLRPLATAGAQTQRLVAVTGMQQTDRNYELQSDTLAQTSLLQIAGISGMLSATDPLWILYYSRQLKGVTDFDPGEAMAAVPQMAREKVISSGGLDWYKREVAILSQRLEAARTTTLERGARILSYHRLLAEYRKISALWADKVIAAAREPARVKVRQNLNDQVVKIDGWTPESDVWTAKEILNKRKY